MIAADPRFSTIKLCETNEIITLRQAYDQALCNARRYQAKGMYEVAALWFKQARRLELALNGR